MTMSSWGRALPVEASDHENSSRRRDHDATDSSHDFVMGNARCGRCNRAAPNDGSCVQIDPGGSNDTALSDPRAR